MSRTGRAVRGRESGSGGARRGQRPRAQAAARFRDQSLVSQSADRIHARFVFLVRSNYTSAEPTSLFYYTRDLRVGEDVRFVFTFPT